MSPSFGARVGGGGRGGRSSCGGQENYLDNYLVMIGQLFG